MGEGSEQGKGQAGGGKRVVEGREKMRERRERVGG